MGTTNAHAQEWAVSVVDALHDAARCETGLSDFGADDYREGLHRVVVELAAQSSDEAALLAASTKAALGVLSGRLWSQESWRQRPDALLAPVPDPVVIAGLPRTATTALHKLMAMDDQFQVLERWILHRPMVRPPRASWDAEPGYQAALARFAASSEASRRFHPVEPHEADECLAIMAQSFVTNLFGSNQDLPAYDDWFLQSDMTPSFTRYADQLRLIGADDGRRWLLKNPSHIFSIDELLAVFPGALVIQTHRHPTEAVGSVVSLLLGINGGTEDPHQRSRRELRMWGEAAARADAARAGREERFCDVDYRDFTSDPLRAVEAVYEHLGLDLTAASRDRMRRWLADNPQGKHGQHRYDPSDLGVTAEAVDAHFAGYIERHHLAEHETMQGRDR